MKKRLTILSIVVVLLMGLLCSQSFASTSLSIGGTNSEANTTIPASSATPTPAATARVVTNTSTVNTATAAPTATANTTASNNIPKTGEVEDYIIFGLIVVFIIAGIITYKKVNSYNNIDM